MKNLAKNFTMSIPPESVDDLENNDYIHNEDIHKDNKDQVENEYVGRSILDIDDKIIYLDIPGSNELRSGEQLYKCEECEASYKHRTNLWHHTRYH